MDSSLILILVNSGVAGVIAILFITGLIYPRPVVADKDRTIAELKEALQAERDRANTAVAAASATRDLMTALQIGQRLGSGGGSGP